MARLYPPQLVGSLPAFYKTYNEDKTRITCTINIPFGINRGVSISDISGLALRLRTTSTNTYIVADHPSVNYDMDNTIATFTFEYIQDDDTSSQIPLKINEGQYYRAQLAFIKKDGEIGYYSTVGIIKCVAKPSVFIGSNLNNGEPLKTDKVNTFDTTFYGLYKQNTKYGDSTEKVYSYKFELFDLLDNLILSTDEMVHDITNDAYSDQSRDYWHIYKELKEEEIYKIRYTVTTINGLIISSIDYRIKKDLSVESEYNLKLYAEANFNEGYIDLSLEGEIEEDDTKYIYRLVDANSDYDNTFIYYIKENDEFIEFESNPNLSEMEQFFEWNQLVSDNRLFIKEYKTITGELPCTGNFVITRTSSKDNEEWVEIIHFSLTNTLPSQFHHYDRTVEQGVTYQYAIQQINQHGIWSRKIKQTDKYGREDTTVMADFEDIFISDGTRHLKIRFNPKVTSFKNTIPEQKIETIGSKYPFIFRNGSVSYKEFPISGLISFQMDEALQFLTPEELKEGKILEFDNYVHTVSNNNNYFRKDIYDATYYQLQHIKFPIYYTALDGRKKIVGYRDIITDYTTKNNKRYIQDNSIRYIHYTNGKTLDQEPTVMRQDRNLTSDNIYSERYFKLKVLEWLTDGNVKLFRSPVEGNYLVRLLNVSLTPQDSLGRMLHQFTCTAYEVEELTYDKLISFGVLTVNTHANYESQWASVDINALLKDEGYINRFVQISPEGALIEEIYIQDFAPGDQIKIKYNEGAESIFSIGVTGSLELNNDDRTITQVFMKPNREIANYNDFSHSFYYRTTNLQLTKFDAITDFETATQTAEQFIGPIDNILEPYILKDHIYEEQDEEGLLAVPKDERIYYPEVYNEIRAHRHVTYMINKNTPKFTGLKVDILHVNKKEIIPIYCYTNTMNINTSKFGITPFGIPYVNSTNIRQFLTEYRNNIKYVDDVLTINDNGQYIKADGVRIEDIITVLDANGVNYTSYDLFEPYFYYEPTQEWISFKEYPTLLPLQIGYYDLYRQEWWDPEIKYDPTFSINELDNNFPEFDEYGQLNEDKDIIGDNNISLLEINEMTLYNLENIQSLHLGNGVVAEVTVQVQEVTYEVEELDSATQQWKKAYHDSIDTLNQKIDLAMTYVDEITDAEDQYADILQEIEEIRNQIDLYQNGSSATEGIMSIAKTRLISQKKQLWDTFEKQLNDILDLLRTQQVYLHINSNSDEGVPALSTEEEDINNMYMHTDEEVVEQNFEEKELTNRNTFWLYGQPSPEESITVNDESITYDIIHNVELFYAKQYETQQNNSQIILDKCEKQLMNLAVQRGNIIGGILEDYDEEHLPPENTLVAVQYQLALIEKQRDDANNRITEIESNYINELFKKVLLENDQTFGNYTDTYLQDNAEVLSQMLTIYINLLKDKASELCPTYADEEPGNGEESPEIVIQDENSNDEVKYDVTEFINKIAALEAQRKLLDAIAINSGWQNRANNNFINEIQNTAVNGLTADEPGEPFIDRINEIRDDYLRAVTGSMEMALSGIGSLDSILHLDSNATLNDKVLAILNLLVDKYNSSSANTVTKTLKEYYYNSSTTSTQEIINKIKNSEAAYKAELVDLDKKEELYKKEVQKYQAQIDEIAKSETAIEQTRQDALIQYNKASEQLALGAAKNSILDSSALIEKIASNERHQNNILLSIEYMNWLETTQKNLLDQIGQIFNNLNTTKDYANLMLNYINAYEIEAFDFLHQYDSIKEDLEAGLGGEDGIDWLYYQPDKYWLNSYKNILFLKDGQMDLPDEYLDPLSDSEEATRLKAYKDLKTYLQELLLGNSEENNEINLGILTEVIVNDDSKKLKYRFVRLVANSEDPLGEFYPLIYELTDFELENPITLQPNQYLLEDAMNYNLGDPSSDPRVFVEVVGVEVSPGVYEYKKDPRANTYYTYRSTVDNLMSAFSKDLSQVTDSEFEAMAIDSISRNMPIKWLTCSLPVSIPVVLHKGLFTNYNCSTISATLEDNPDIFLIQPEYHKYFDKALGLIIHDERNGSEYGSWLGLKELDSSFWSVLASYATAWAKYINLKNTNNTAIADYERLYKISTEMGAQLEYYKNVALECHTVLSSYDAQQISDDSPDKQQLLILLETAEEEIAYYSEQKAIYDAQLEIILNNNESFKEYLEYDKALITTAIELNDIYEKYNQQYEAYKEKVNHYLMLLFNDAPYGKLIDTNIVHNKNILSINNNDTSMYNFGLAYAIEAYKSNVNNEEDINFNVILTGINTLNEALNNNFDFIFPTFSYDLVEPGANYSPNKKYYYLDENNTYKIYSYDAYNWQDDINNQIVYVYNNSEPYQVPGRTYYIKNNNKYTLYRAIDETKWEEDKYNSFIYYTNYPSLIDFADTENYRLINELDSFDENIQYYYHVNNTYIPAIIIKENWKNTIARGNVYIKVGNGGLKGFLNNMLNESAYMQKLKNNYIGTLELYFSLLAQTLGDSTSLDNLQSALTKDLIKQKELEEIIANKNGQNVDIHALIEDIYQNYTLYLISLTIAYTELVERSYGL